MDAKASYPLVCLPPEQGTLVPVATTLVVDADADSPDDADFQDRLWQCFCKLAWLLWLAWIVVRHLRNQVAELRQQAHYWRVLHQRAVQREAKLAEQIHLLHGEIRDLKRRLFGRKSETSSSTKPRPKTNAVPPNPNDNPQRRSRGQQSGSTGHGRRDHDHLPTTHEPCVLPAEPCCCAQCGQPFEEIPGTADGDILEIEVRAYRRRYHRQRYRRCCTCPRLPAVITAPPPDKLIPKSNLGLSLWVMILQHKFRFFQPLHRILAELRSHGLDLAAGTITGGLQKIVPLLQPLYQLLIEHNRAEEHWHCDETRWFVFEKHAGKAGFQWMLWVFAAQESIVFVLDPTRSHDVPEGHFGDTAAGIASVDRYSAYKAMAQVKAGKIILSFCWAHVRRDFLTVLTGWTELTDWAWSWVEAIGALYHGNDERLAVLEDASKFAEADRRLRDQVEQMRQRCDQELSQPNLREPQRKALTSLQTHWSGLTVFVAHPEVPMDNNKAERCHRGPVLGRKNFYGSGSLWSGRLAAMLFSLFQTVEAWGLDVARWLTHYLSACAQAQGQPPPEPHRYLPWNMSPQQRQHLSLANAPSSGPTNHCCFIVSQG